MSQYSVENCMGSTIITYTKCITVPGMTRLNSSYGYCGIDSGVVEVLEIIDISAPDNYYRLQSVIEGNLDSIAGLADRVTNTHVELTEYYTTCEYIAYRYKDNEDEILYLDIDTFLSHSSEI